MSPEVIANPVRQPTKTERLMRSMAFLSAYGIFAGLGVVSSVLCYVAAILFKGARSQYFGQAIISGLFRFFVEYLRFFGLVYVEAGELANVRNCRGVIFVANHPTLLDVVHITAYLPRVFCLMKASLTNNLVLSGQSLLAGYVNNASGIGLVKACEERINKGGNLLIFPEGTRSDGTRLRPFRMGFALVAKRSRVPVQALLISVSENYLGKTWPFFKQPKFPMSFSIKLGERFEARQNEDAKAFGGRVESYFRESLARGA
ncbi:MAG TPA: lysophospholipid acyltransferase family protein [Verrucomicrobiae bacterium]|nr:lysophospholipid acyltransferase family protein [Verrucomicrobiae bacterium]